MKRLIILLGIALLALSCEYEKLQSQPIHFAKSSMIDGLSFVAPPEPFPDNPMPAVQEVGADWIAIMPFAFTRSGQAEVHYDANRWRWWGERPEGVEETIRLAKAAGLQIMLKPQVYIPGGWPGGLDFQTEEEWQNWENSYEDYLMIFVAIAKKYDLPLFCIGTEFKMSSTGRPQFWRKLIQKIRAEYQGQLTYAANWDEYQQITFWEDLDYIGIDAYFPLVDKPTPTVEELVRAWRKPERAIRTFAYEQKKPVLFTEFGYLSVDRTAYNHWEREAEIKQLAVNEQAQANALQALFEVFWAKNYWHGGFLWKWFPNNQGHEGYPEKDYTPQGKLAATTLQNWYGK